MEIDKWHPSRRSEAKNVGFTGARIDHSLLECHTQVLVGTIIGLENLPPSFGIVIRAGCLGWRMGGIEWRRTHCSAEEINKGRRVWL